MIGGKAPWALALAVGASAGAGGGCGDDAAPDRTALEITLTRAPEAHSASAIATFAFEANLPATFRCRLDEAAPVPCTSPWGVVDLGDGPHTFSVLGAAEDPAWVAPDVTPPVHTWTVDTTAPETMLRAAPPSVDNDATVWIEFGADDDQATFGCAFDGAAVPCTSPWRIDGVLDGDHVVEVAAIDRAGNRDRSPARVAWVRDSRLPQTVLTQVPDAVTGPRTEVAFAADNAGPGVTFECFVDGGSIGPCTSPQALGPLGEGFRSLRVVARSAALVEDPSPPVHAWRVDATAPTVAITAVPRPAESRRPTIEFAVSPDAAAVTCTAGDDVGPLWCATPFTFPTVGAGPVELAVTATDEYGNAATATATIDVRPTGWSRLSALPEARYLGAMAYDATRGEVVLFGGVSNSGYLGGTWIWDGVAWQRRSPAVSPQPRQGAVMVYDVARGEVILNGGVAGLLLDDTWSWDGTTWTQRFPATTPGGVLGHVASYHAATQRIVLFGGQDNTVGYRDETWLWDGVDWTRATTTSTPPARTYTSMADDPARGRTVLFGGYDGGFLADTWEWDGSDWLEVESFAASGGVYGMQLSYVPGRGVVRIGGSPGGEWTWDGSTWTEDGSAGPAAIVFVTAAFDLGRGELVAQGGTDPMSGVPIDTSWIDDGSGWVRRPFAPPAVAGPGLAFDAARDELVVFGGNDPWSGATLGDTLLRDGDGTWRTVAASGPPPRSHAVMAYEPSTERVILYGGAASGFFYDDTWSWDGTAWTSLGAGPPGRSEAAFAYDPVRARLVVFGGYVAGTYADDTWEWDGVAWSQAFPATAPSPRAAASLAFDGDQLVLFGGRDGFGNVFDETWRWDGADWAYLSAGTPWAASGASAVYDVARDRVMLLGGYSPWNGAIGTPWIRTLGAWRVHEPETPLPAGYDAAIAHDEASGRTFLFGGYDASGYPTSALWSFDEVTP